MSITLVGFLLGAFAGYCYLFTRRSGIVQRTILIPFLYRLHAPNVLSTLTDEEHQGVHDQIDIFNLRIFSCFIAAIIAIGVSGLFIMLASSGGNATISGYIMAICFAYVGANYDLNSKIVTWVRLSENEIMGRIMQKNADEGGHESLSDYLAAENERMLKDWTDEVTKAGEEFEQRLVELGFDETRDYTETPEAEQELVDMLEKVTEEMEENRPEHHDL